MAIANDRSMPWACQGTTVHRRAVLAGAALLVTPAASANGKTPVAAIFDEWCAHRRSMQDTEHLIIDDDSRYAMLSDVQVEIESRLYAEPAQCEHDICLKLAAITLGGIDFADDGRGNGRRIAREAAAWVGQRAEGGAF